MTPPTAPESLADLRESIEDALCPAWHREGMVVSIVGQAPKSGPRSVCALHRAEVSALLAVIAPALDAAEAQVERGRALADQWDEESAAEGTPMISLALSPWEVFRTLEALEESRGYVALQVATKIREAAPYHLAVLADAGPTRARVIPPGDGPREAHERQER